MKNVLLLCLLCYSLSAAAQDPYAGIPRDSATGKLAYQGIVPVPGASKEALFVRAHEWVSATFRSAKDVVQLDDKQAGVLVVKGCYIPTSIGSTGIYATYYWHTVKIEVKDGRFRYTITDFYKEGGTRLTAFPPQMEEQILHTARATGSGFKNGSPKRTYREDLNGVRIPGESEAASLRAAMTVKPKDF